MQISLTVCTCVYCICVSILSRISSTVGKYKLHSFIHYRFAFGLLFFLCNHFQKSIIVHLICFELLIQNHIKLTNRCYCYFLPTFAIIDDSSKKSENVTITLTPRQGARGVGWYKSAIVPTNQYISFFIEDIRYIEKQKKFVIKKRL